MFKYLHGTLYQTVNVCIQLNEKLVASFHGPLLTKQRPWLVLLRQIGNKRGFPENEILGKPNAREWNAINTTFVKENKGEKVKSGRETQ